MAGLSETSTADLIAELGMRDVRTETGALTPEAWRIVTSWLMRVCVDGVPVRLGEGGTIELMAISRGTGPYAGRLCLVGGGIGVERESSGGIRWEPESPEEALRRHFKTDLGMEVEPVVSWGESQVLAQDMAPRPDGTVKPGFCPNRDAPAGLLAVRYLVRVNPEIPEDYGSTAVGGQEATGVVWFNRDEMPPADAFGYNHGATYEQMFDVAERLDRQGLLFPAQPAA